MQHPRCVGLACVGVGGVGALGGGRGAQTQSAKAAPTTTIIAVHGQVLIVGAQLIIADAAALVVLVAWVLAIIVALVVLAIRVGPGSLALVDHLPVRLLHHFTGHKWARGLVAVIRTRESR